MLADALDFVDVVLCNHPEATSSEIHQIMGRYLKMAPHRHGGAGKGAHLERVDSGDENALYEATTRDSDVESDDSHMVSDDNNN